MSKIGAVLVGTISLFVLSFSLLPTAFSPIINWLGPILGVPLQVMLTLLFFTMASPVSYPVVLMTWIVAGVIVGLFARRVKPAIASASLVYSCTFSILGLAIGAVILRASQSGLVSGTLPPAPPGTNTATILNVPVFKSFAPLLIQGLSSGGSSMPSTGSIISLVIPPIIENLLILTLTSIGVGFGMSKVTKMLKPKHTLQTVPSLATSAPGINTVMKVVALLALAILIAFSGIGIYAGAQSNTFSYSEVVLSVVNSDGSATNYYGFVTDSLSLSSQGTTLSTQLLSGTGTLAAVIASQAQSSSFVSEFLSQSAVSSFSSYLSLIPPTLVLLIYDGSCSATQTQASGASSAFSTIFQLNDLNLLASHGFSGSNLGLSSVSHVCIYLYQSNADLGTVAGQFVTNVLPAVHQGGLIDIFEQGLSSGFLVPGATSTSVNSSAILAGFINPQLLSNFQAIGQGIQNVTSSLSMVGFSAGIALQDSLFHSSSTTHTASFVSLVDYQQPLAFASGSSFSAAGLGVPLQSAQRNAGFSPSNYKFTIATNNAQALSSFSGGQSTFLPVNSGETVTSQQLQSSFTELFPANLQVLKSLTQSGNNVHVSITVHNLDSDSLSNLVMNDSQFVHDYGDSLKVISGTPVNGTIDSLAPGAAVTYSYSIRLSGVGTLVAPAAEVLYTLNDTQFQQQSNSANLNYSVPASSQALGALVSTAGVAFDGFVGTGGYGASIVTVILVALFGLAGFMEYRSFIEWRRDPS